MKNRFRKALLERTPTFGAWIQMGHPASAEILGRLGYDWVCVDLEHGSIDIGKMVDLFRAISAFGAVPVARLPYADTIWIKRSLDAGARGLIVPMVNSAAIAREALRQAKHPPLGERGYGFHRGNLHGIDFEQYIREANDEIAVVMQIEHRSAIESIDAILKVEGVDGAFIGPMDLSGSYGKTGQLDCPEMIDATGRFLDACSRRRIAAGMHIVRPAERNIEAAIAQGFTMVALGLDVVFLAAGAEQALRSARASAAAQI